MIPGEPTRETLEGIVAFAERRFGRAHEKLRAAQTEVDAADAARTSAIANLAGWHEANPDPQMPLPIGE